MPISKEDLGGRLDALETRFAGTVIVHARHLSTGEEVSRHAHELWGTASAIKTAILCATYLEAASGAVRPDERVLMSASDRVGGTGVMKLLDGGVQATVHDLAVLMIVQSDNTATNLLLDLIGGPERVNSRMRELGLDDIILHNGAHFEKIGTDIRRFGEASAESLCELMARLHAGLVVNADVSGAIIEILRMQQQLDCTPRYLEIDPFTDALGRDINIVYGGKTGIWPGIRTDVGLISLRSGGEFAFCVMAQGSSDETFAVESEPAVICGLVGRLLVEYWWRGPAPAPVLATPYMTLTDVKGRGSTKEVG